MNIKKILEFSIGPIGGALLGISTVPILAWTFSPEDIGRFTVLQIIMSFSCILFTMGLDQSYVREYYESIDKYSLFKTVVLAPLVVFLLVIIVNINHLDFFAKKAYQIESKDLSWITLICILLTILLRYISLTIRMQERGLLFSISQLTPKILLLLFIFFLNVFDWGAGNFYNLILMQLTSLFIIFIIFIIFIKKEVRLSIKAKFDFHRLKKLLVFGFPLVISGLVFWLMQSLSRIVLLDLSSLTELGIFGVAVSIAAGFSVLTAIFNTVWVPIIYKLVKEGKGIDEVKKVSEFIAFMISFLILVSCLFMPIIPSVLPSIYSGIEYIFILCILQPLFYTLSESTSVGILVSKKTKYSILVSLLVLVLNYFLLIYMVPGCGALGAALSIAISFWVYFVIRTEFSNMLWRKFNRIKIYVSSLISLCFVIFLSFEELTYLYAVLGGSIVFLINIILFVATLKVFFKNISIQLRSS